ncbi:hypothetical protein AC1031_009987 [Aphanomyces cochlioides]|nr:hypothetical protein AC1031_009987 [Aphanomyces cochlioides]
MTRVTASLLLERAGIYEVLGTKELILRDEAIDEFEESCAKDLVSLELLSLSHNALRTLTHFEHLTNLIELNINFNHVESLDGLQCYGLQKLYAANNKLTSIAQLRAFSKLVHVSVYGNELSDLDAALHTCRQLVKLRSVDLDGNPCARTKHYKYQVLRLLPRINELDGETIHALDREMLLEQEPPLAPTPRTSLPPGPPIDLAEAAEIRGPVQLFRDEFLNNHPILLEYLAQGVQDADPPQASADSMASPRPSLFVDKMRLANPDPTAADQEQPQVSTPPKCPMAATPTVVPSHAIVDPSDPNATIRRLLKHIDHLTSSLDASRAQASDQAIAALMEENSQLRIENSNIPILQDEITSLKYQLRHATQQTSQPLEAENAALKRQIAKLRSMLATKEADSPELTKEQVLEEAATVDVELTALIMQNEISLQIMRQTIQKTKLDMLNDRVAQMTGHYRPSTSAGIATKAMPSPATPESPQSGRPRRRLHTSAGHRPSKSNLSTSFRRDKKIPTVVEEDNNTTADLLVL